MTEFRQVKPPPGFPHSAHRRRVVPLLALLLAGCGLLSVEARAAARPQRPLVFLPGVLGSRLCDQEGELLWGGAASYSNLEDLALGPDPGATPIQACGVVESIKLFGPLSVHQYDTLLEHLRDKGYERGKTLFVFDYDWRQSNFESARRLAGELAPILQAHPEGVDVIGHSMGGIVARIYIQELGGAAKVRRLVTLGTPHSGSLQIFKLLTDGFSGWGNFLAGGREAVQRVAFTFPSAYELLPFYPNCCALGRPEWPKSDKRPFDFRDPEPWFESWLPRPFTAEPWSGRVRQMLGDARRLRELLERPIPGLQRFRPAAGTGLATLSTVYVDPASYAIIDWAELETGDGTVLEVSAANGRLDLAVVSFSQHAVIFRDRHLRTSLDRILGLSTGGPVRFGRLAEPLTARTDDGDHLAVSAVDLTVRPRWVEADEPIEVTLRLAIEEGSTGTLSVAGGLETAGAEASTFALEPDAATAPGQRLYRATLRTDRPGTHRVRVDVPGLPQSLEQYVVVAARRREGAADE